MYLNTIALNTILVLMITKQTVLALPDTLNRRYNFAWIGSSKEPNCHSELVGPRPKVRLNHCVKFSPLSNNIHVFFGAGFYNILRVELFKDEHCKEDTHMMFGGAGHPAGQDECGEAEDNLWPLQER